MSVEPNKIIYSMIGVSKFYQKKPILKDIYLSYFYGAKIGVVGLNGSGKSSLLRILAGWTRILTGRPLSLRVTPSVFSSRNRNWNREKRCGKSWSRESRGPSIF